MSDADKRGGYVYKEIISSMSSVDDTVYLFHMHLKFITCTFNSANLVISSNFHLVMFLEQSGGN